MIPAPLMYVEDESSPQSACGSQPVTCWCWSYSDHTRDPEIEQHGERPTHLHRLFVGQGAVEQKQKLAAMQRFSSLMLAGKLE
jgi:hypothetical protein